MKPIPTGRARSMPRQKTNEASGQGRLRSPFVIANGAFTLIEVLLAVGLATGLLVVALVFYRQASNLRTEILRASENLSSIRLTLDRIVSDLRTATAHPSVPFVGGPSTLEFARLSPGSFPPAPLRISISAPVEQDGTNLVVRGLSRTELPLGAAPMRPLPVATNDPGFTPDFPPSAATNVLRQAPPLVEAIRYVHFRFWNGAAWQDSWLAPAPPAAVEINVGADPIPDDATPETYPFELFRRVVLIPAGRNPDPASDTNSIPDLFDSPLAP